MNKAEMIRLIKKIVFLRTGHWITGKEFGRLHKIINRFSLKVVASQINKMPTMAMEDPLSYLEKMCQSYMMSDRSISNSRSLTNNLLKDIKNVDD